MSMSFGPVADAYDRARPGYPEAAARWLTGPRPVTVLELGAGTGKLTARLRGHGHRVLATDPSPEMLQRLAAGVPVRPVVARAERIPLRSRSVDVVVCAQSFHWFDHRVALPEIARVLRPGGVLALAWNVYDTGIPWVRRLKRLLSPDEPDDPARAAAEGAVPLMETPYFGFVEQAQFRFWQTHTAASLADLTRSVSHVATLSPVERDGVLHRVEELYADYGRGHDGMQVPWITHCFKAAVRHQELPPDEPPPKPARTGDTGPARATGADAATPEDPGTQLIDFR